MNKGRQPGDVVSHYELVTQLGAGGMGIVYKAQDLKLDRFVALKFLPPHLEYEGEEKQRFIQEARAAAAIEHPHIGTVHDIDEIDGRTYIIMEYVRGESLRRTTSESKLPTRKSLDLAIQIADGLGQAHESRSTVCSTRPVSRTSGRRSSSLATF